MSFRRCNLDRWLGPKDRDTPVSTEADEAAAWIIAHNTAHWDRVMEEGPSVDDFDPQIFATLPPRPSLEELLAGTEFEDWLEPPTSGRPDHG